MSVLRSHSASNAPQFVTQLSSSLVPGDVVRIHRGMKPPCDLILMRGSVVVNEATLSGESVPIFKNPLYHTGKEDGAQKIDLSQVSEALNQRQNRNCCRVCVCFFYLFVCLFLVFPLLLLPIMCLLLVTQNSSHILFAGSEVLGFCGMATQSACTLSAIEAPLASWGLVVRTGFQTMQGQMMRGILFPDSRRRSELIHECYKFLAALAALAFLLAFMSLAVTLSQGLHPKVVVIRVLDTFTNAVPPALLTALTVGVAVAVIK